MIVFFAYFRKKLPIQIREHRWFSLRIRKAFQRDVINHLGFILPKSVRILFLRVGFGSITIGPPVPRLKITQCQNA